MDNILSINDLKRSSLTKIKNILQQETDIIVQERGKDACVLVAVEHYRYLRECELQVALLQAQKEIAQGKFKS